MHTRSTQDTIFSYDIKKSKKQKDQNKKSNLNVYIINFKNSLGII